VGRDLRDRHHRAVGVDLSPTLLRRAREADAGGACLLADGAALPLGDATCDPVVAYDWLMDVADMPGAVAEAARIPAPGGRLRVCVTHPIENTGRFESENPKPRSPSPTPTSAADASRPRRGAAGWR